MKITQIFTILLSFAFLQNFYIASAAELNVDENRWYVSIIKPDGSLVCLKIDDGRNQLSVDEIFYQLYPELLNSDNKKEFLFTWEYKSKDWNLKIENDSIIIQIPQIINQNEDYEDLTENQVIEKFDLPPSKTELTDRVKISRGMSKYIYLKIFEQNQIALGQTSCTIQ